MLVSYRFFMHKYAKQFSLDFSLKAIDSQKMFVQLKRDKMTSCSNGKYLVFSYTLNEILFRENKNKMKQLNLNVGIVIEIR